MKRIIFLGFALLISFYLKAQDISGQWNGSLNVQGTQLRLVFDITKTANGYTATMDSPDQGAKGIPVTNTVFEHPRIFMEITNAKIEYSGELKDGEIIGTFKQAGREFPMNLRRKPIEKITAKRPQEPVKTYPYYSEDISFKNLNAGITLAGTLTLPAKDGKYPVVVLISGSGPQNRDEELMGHKPFLVLADHLTRHGIGVLRFDDRGVGQSGGDFKTATSPDFASDVETAITYLKTRKEIDKSKIGLVGHSEGGMIAPMVASQSKDVAFIVLLAGTGLTGDQILLLQQHLIGKASGLSDSVLAESAVINRKVFDIIRQSKNADDLNIDLTQYLKQVLINSPNSGKPAGMTDEEFVRLQVTQITSPWMQYFIKYDPAPTLQKVKVPVLAINGEKDLQVPAKENLAAIKTAVEKGGNKKITTMELPNLNHLFQESKTGLPTEYASIEQTFSPAALEIITNWIKAQTK